MQGIQSALNNHIPTLKKAPLVISEEQKHSLGQVSMTKTQLTLTHCTVQIKIYSLLNPKFDHITFPRETKFQ